MSCHVMGVGMNVGPYMVYIVYKKGGFWGPNKFHHEFLTFFGNILTIKMDDFLKLELFLRPSLKTRSHDGSAHTFKSSPRYLEVPQKGV